MRIKAIICLPGVAVASVVLDLRDSRLVHLPFSQWLALEGQTQSAVYDKLGRNYDYNPPVFWEKEINVDPNLVMTRNHENTRLLFNLVEPDIDLVDKALHWYTGTAPVHPKHSVGYFDPTSEQTFAEFPDLQTFISANGVQRYYGESDKEYATQNEHPTLFLHDIDEAPLADMVAFVRQTKEVWTHEEYILASQSLSLLSTPGLDWSSRLLLLVGAYESLFLPDRKTDLTKGFEKRLSCMVANNFDEMTQARSWFKLAYQLRNTLVHGQSIARVLKTLSVPLDEYMTTLRRAGVLALTRLIRYRYVHPEVCERSDPLWTMLDGAEKDAEAFAGLKAQLSPPSELCISHQWHQWYWK